LEIGKRDRHLAFQSATFTAMCVRNASHVGVVGEFGQAQRLVGGRQRAVAGRSEVRTRGRGCFGRMKTELTRPFHPSAFILLQTAQAAVQ
jgi:hypothetical protein